MGTSFKINFYMCQLKNLFPKVTTAKKSVLFLVLIVATHKTILIGCKIVHRRLHKNNADMRITSH